MYGNEKEVGEAISRSGLDRSDVFVTSKLNNDAHGPTTPAGPSTASLETLGLDYVDLFLIHWPLPTRYGGDLRVDLEDPGGVLPATAGPGRSASPTSSPHHLRRLHGESEITPAVNQIEVHPYLTQDEVRAFCAEHQIAIEAWSPIAQGRCSATRRSREIAERVGKTPAQVVLRWHIERGDIVFPKSVTPGADQGELRHLRLRAVRRGRRGDQRAEP